MIQPSPLDRHWLALTRWADAHGVQHVLPDGAERRTLADLRQDALRLAEAADKRLQHDALHPLPAGLSTLPSQLAQIVAAGRRRGAKVLRQAGRTGRRTGHAIAADPVPVLVGVVVVVLAFHLFSPRKSRR